MTRVALLEREHPRSHRGAIAGPLVTALRNRGLAVQIVHAETGLHRLDRRPAWDLVVLKSGSAAALHLAAAAEAYGIPSVNSAEATRLAQDRLAAMAILLQAGLPVPPARLAWLAAGRRPPTTERPVIVKAARGSQGAGLWEAAAGELEPLAERLPPGPYLVMEHAEHAGDDLKVFAAGAWLAAIERPFPARTLAEKRGRPLPVPAEAAEVARAAGELLGLTCFGCDFVRTADSWRLVDVNAFPGYKGAAGAPAALAAAVARAAREAA
jgi:ribosomal protein S6--L-glutamate ligase